MLCETRFADDKRVFSLFSKWHSDRVPGFTWFYLVLLTPPAVSKGEKAIQQRLDNKLEAAAADHLTFPRLKTLNPNLRTQRKKTKNSHDPPSSDVTEF